ncbi:MAG: hypothetical protein V1845_02120 [bacterium]
MPYSMPYSEQKNRWFSLLLIAGLPFFVIFKWVKGDLPYIQNPNIKNKI